MVISILGDLGAEMGRGKVGTGEKEKNKQTTKIYSRRRKVVIDLSPPTVFFFRPVPTFPCPTFCPREVNK